MRPVEEIAANVVRIRERIERASARAGRNPADVTLVAVSKTHPPELIEAAAESGVRDFGENRVQEASDKIPLVGAPGLRWHLIGHLQRNKARRALQLFDLVHSLDSLRLAEALNRVVQEHEAASPGSGERRLPVLLQLNVAGEEQKEGFDLTGGLGNVPAWERLCDEIKAIAELPGLEIRGLMTIAPYVSNPEQARPVFQAIREVRDALAARFPNATWRELSMGMTNDFEVAVEEGATLVRVGRALFGNRG